jgi:hypothetical protein
MAVKSFKEKPGILNLSLIKQAVADVLQEKQIATKKDVENIVVDAINTVVVPGMDNMTEDIKS